MDPNSIRSVDLNPESDSGIGYRIRIPDSDSGFGFWISDSDSGFRIRIPDSDSYSGFGIRIRNADSDSTSDSGFVFQIRNLDPGFGSGSRRAKMIHKNRIKEEISCFEVLDVLF